MITKKIWKDIIFDLCVDPIDYMFGIMWSLITIPFDILLLPFEIMGFIVYKIVERG
ncbi:MAG: hypothetical protein MR691_08125 [Clostridium sp.]|nr:hypothetical protein [Clostridium sp.]